MTTREERIQAKMAAIIAAKEEKEILREAKRRLQELEKKQKEIEHEAHEAKRQDYLDSPEGKAYIEAKNALLVTQQKQTEEEDTMREAVKIAFYSYYSRRHAAEYNPDLIERHKVAVEMSVTMFKKNQKRLIELGITVEHFKNPNINRVRIEGDPFYGRGGNGGWQNKVIDHSFLLTVDKPLIETNTWYALNGTMSPHSGGGKYNPKWIE